MGVLGEDANACYAALMARVKAEDGSEANQSTVFAVTVVRGKLVYYYLCAPFVSPQTLTDMLARVKVDLAALQAANRN